MCFIFRFLKGEGGAASVEYAVVLALILMVVFTAVGLVGFQTGELWGDVATSIATE